MTGVRRRHGPAGPLAPLVASTGLAVGTVLCAALAACGGGGPPVSSGTVPNSQSATPYSAPPPSSPAEPSSRHTASPKPSLSHPSGTGTPDIKRGGNPFASASLRRYLAGRTGQVTAALYDARAKRTWVLHPGVKEYTASIVKVQIMGTALAEAQIGGHVPSDQAALMPPMIEASDNDAATSMLAKVGGPDAVARFDHTAGMTDTVPSRQALIPGTDLPGWGLTTTTALDEVYLVARFAYPSRVLDSASRSYGLSLMEQVEPGQNWGVTGGVPAGTTVALKNGWLPVAGKGWQVDSIGWVNGHGRNYVLAVLISGNPNEAYGIDTIEKIARVVYQSRSGA
jgi:hypothetical protein